MRHILVQKPYPNLNKPFVQEGQIETKELSDQGELVGIKDPSGTLHGIALLAAEQKSVACLISESSALTVEEWLNSAVERAIEGRLPYFNQEDTTAFRLINAEGDRLPGLTVDVYQDYLVVNVYTKSIEVYLEDILDRIEQKMPVKGVVVKRRYQSINVPDSEWIRGEEAPAPLMVKENGLVYATYLNEGWMTGIFLDQREVRRYLLDTSQPSDRLLNLFSYTGAFSIGTAVKGGHTTSVDVANRSRALTEEQFRLNGIEPSQQAIYVFDAFKFLPYAKRQGMKFNRIVIDPPSFARTKKRIFRVVKDYPELIQESLPVLDKGGELILSTNAAHWPSRSFDQMIAASFKKNARSYRCVKSFGLPADFKTPKQSSLSHYLKVRVLKVD